MNVCGIYKIVNLVDGLCYVGSAINIGERWRVHVRSLRRRSHHSHRLQSAWDAHGADAFAIKIVEVVLSRTELVERENFWIGSMRAVEPDRGYNIAPTAGSQLGFRHTVATRAKMSASHKGRAKTPEHQAKITAALKGKRMSEEQKRHLSDIRKGKKASPELRAKLREAQRNRKMSPEARERMITANVGRRFTAEHKARIAKALEGYRLRSALADNAAD